MEIIPAWAYCRFSCFWNDRSNVPVENYISLEAREFFLAEMRRYFLWSFLTHKCEGKNICILTLT